MGKKRVTKALESRFVSEFDHNNWLSELCKQRDYITLSIKELEVVLQK